MLRIGIAASKMSKGSLLSYNLYVILIAVLLSLLISLICGFFILLVVFLIFLIMHALNHGVDRAGWVPMFKFCLRFLALVVGVFSIAAIMKNIQLRKNKT